MTNSTDPKRGHKLEEIARLLELDFTNTDGLHEQRSAANDAEYTVLTAHDFFRVCHDTERTVHLTRLAGLLLGKGMQTAGAIELCSAWNARNDPPLPEAKVRHTVASIARTHERNHPPEHHPDEPLFDLEAARVDRFLNYDPPPRKWLLVDCLPLGKVGLLVAPGGTGKSQLALQLAIAVATGGSLADWWQVGEKGRVLALFAEEDEEELHRRVWTILRGWKSTPETYQRDVDLRKNLFIKSMAASDNLMTKADHVGAVVRTDYVERLCATVKELPDLKLIIIDPASRFRGGNENTAEDATRFVEALELIVKTTGATVLVLHHANKASTSKDSEQSQGASRGSSALTDGVRFQMNLAALSNKQAQELGLEDDAKRDEYIAVKITKSNYAAAGGTVFLHRSTQGVLSYHEPTEVQRAAQADRLKLLVQMVREGAPKGHDHSKSSFAKCHGGKERLFNMGINSLERLIDQAIANGFLTQGPGPARTLQATDKPTEIAKAKVIGGGHVNGGT